MSHVGLQSFFFFFFLLMNAVLSALVVSEKAGTRVNASQQGISKEAGQ